MENGEDKTWLQQKENILGVFPLYFEIQWVRNILFERLQISFARIRIEIVTA